MRKYFNTTGLCYPKEHYMVDMKERLEAIRKMVDRGEYFAINRARQYGKTTMLHLLAEKLMPDYAVFSIGFEGIEDETYESSERFCRRFGKMDMEDLSDLIDYRGQQIVCELKIWHGQEYNT